MDASDIGTDLKEVLITPEQLAQRIRELAAEIDADYAERELLLVGVLKGAVMVMADLARALHQPVQMDWMAISSYGSGTKSSGVVRILKDLDADISGRHVLVVEDIVDSGLTLSWLIGNLESRGPASVAVCVLLRKPSAARMNVKVAYTGFDIDDSFVVGYGLDYAEKYRNLPFIGTLAEHVYRPDILDPALLRPGRFDRQIVVAQPDLAGRKGILRVHARGKPFASDVDLDVIARRTPGFTGADLANVINEGALLTARANQTQVSMASLEEAIDRVTAGPERKSVLLSEKERKIIAYHEGGHALVGHALPNADPVHKITIIPRGRALGYTAAAPAEDKFLVSRAELMDQLAMLLGGRTAEELVFHEPTTGAANDIEKASSVARGMVTEYGMSERLGARKFGTGDSEPFLGREMSHARDYSEEIASAIDDEVRRLIESAHDEAWEILVQYRDVLDTLVLQLLEHETLSREQVLQIFAPVHKRPSRGSYTGYGKRLPSDRPPVLSPKELALTAASDGNMPPSLGNGQAASASGLPAGQGSAGGYGALGGASSLGGADRESGDDGGSDGEVR